ncbi:unnamed protein product [Prorocentrum cordatum]|uniref:Uncharacterized protein n=1 Tax=Prorocentrum cordatum TaxID=2364126 RepID=A0ABN9U1Z5_9DINO|nr:unnamed protein product [Polarella glacialis]
MERGGRRREEEEEEEEEEEDLDVRAVRLPGRKRARGRAGRRRARGPLPASPPDWQRVCPPPGLGGAPMTGKAQKARRSLAAGLPSRLGGAPMTGKARKARRYRHHRPPPCQC